MKQNISKTSVLTESEGKVGMLHTMKKNNDTIIVLTSLGRLMHITKCLRIYHGFDKLEVIRVDNWLRNMTRYIQVLGTSNMCQNYDVVSEYTYIKPQALNHYLPQTL